MPNLNDKENIVWHDHKVSKQERTKNKGHKSPIIWFTGLSGSGKSTIANELDHALHCRRIHSYVLDGDNIRHGLNKGLGFSSEDRKENVRRVGEVAKLFSDAGVLTIAAFISPFAEDRNAVRRSVDKNDFIEIYTKCPLNECRKRDPKGLYEKAVAGEIQNFTGINHPYEEPRDPEIVLETDRLSVSDCVERIISYLLKVGFITLA